MADLQLEDELVLVSDHGLQEGLHTDEAMIAAIGPRVVDAVGGVLDIRNVVEELLERGKQTPSAAMIGELGSSPTRFKNSSRILAMCDTPSAL